MRGTLGGPLRSLAVHALDRMGGWAACLLAVWFLGCSSTAEATPFVPERVDSTTFGTHSSLAVDAKGNPHIAYQSTGASDLKYARKEGGSWIIETVDAPGFVGAGASIVLDALGNPHVSYRDDFPNDNLKYATKSGGTWTIELVDATGDVGASSSIRIDSQGNPHISYLDMTTVGNADLKYARKVGGVWSVETVDATGNTGFTPSLALDKQDAPRIAYWDQTSGDLRYASKSGATWTLTTVDAGGNVGAEPSLKLDGQGNPRISYKDIGLGDLKFASRSGITWTLETVDAGGNVGNDTSLWLDANDNPRISYYDVTNTDLKYAVKSGGIWTLETVDGGASSVGQSTSLDFDHQGNPAISYAESGTAAFVKFANSAVRVASQLAGATWPVGSLRTVAWSGVGPITLSLSVDGGATYQSLLNGVVANQVSIRVPHTPTRFARIRVERGTPFSTSESDSFFTIQTSIAMLSLLAAKLPAGGVEVRWSTNPAPPDIMGYRLEKQSGEGWQPVAPILTSQRYVDTDGGPGSRYRLFAVNALGEDLLLGETRLLPIGPLAAWPLPYRGGGLSISFATASGLGGGPVLTDLSLYDVSGRKIRRIVTGDYPPGYQVVTWDGRDDGGQEVPSGVYFLRSASAGEARFTKVVVAR